MEQCTTEAQALQLGPRDVLTEVLRHGAQKMLAEAIGNEVDEYLGAHVEARDEAGRRLVVGNGFLPQRSILTGVGPVEVRQPRVNDKRVDENGKAH